MMLDRLRQAVEAGFAQQTAFLTDLVRFPSIRGEEAPLQDWMARQLAARGYSVDRYVLGDIDMSHLPGFSPVMDTDYSRAVQVVGTRRATAPSGRSLIIQGHVDVVPTGPTALWSTPP
ncbi:MAG: ArgE/DapE family deacylase, partial [Janthinobacterium lividum]